MHFPLHNFSHYKIFSKLFHVVFMIRSSNFFSIKYEIFSEFFVLHFRLGKFFLVKYLVFKIGENILTKIFWNPIFSD